jgi:2-haloacid dehalogenase
MAPIPARIHMANEQHEPLQAFSAVTLQSLHHALAESSENLSKEAIEKLMKAYDSLDTFPDVEPALKAVAADPSIDTYVFSNGTDAMVSSARR